MNPLPSFLTPQCREHLSCYGFKRKQGSKGSQRKLTSVAKCQSCSVNKGFLLAFPPFSGEFTWTKWKGKKKHKQNTNNWIVERHDVFRVLQKSFGSLFCVKNTVEAIQDIKFIDLRIRGIRTETLSFKDIPSANI